MRRAPATSTERQIRLEFRFIGYDVQQAAKSADGVSRSVTTVTDRILFGAAKFQLPPRQAFVN
jgi:hypothetical protein